MTITTEDLLDDAARVVATDLYPERCRTVIANLAAELIAARAKIEAAEKMAEAVKHEREMVCQDMGMQMDMSAWTDEMLAKWESLK